MYNIVTVSPWSLHHKTMPTGQKCQLYGVYFNKTLMFEGLTSQQKVVANKILKIDIKFEKTI